MTTPAYKPWIDPSKAHERAPTPFDMLQLLIYGRDPTFAVLVIEPRRENRQEYLGELCRWTAEGLPMLKFHRTSYGLEIPGLGRIVIADNEHGARGRVLDRIYRGITL